MLITIARTRVVERLTKCADGKQLRICGRRSTEKRTSLGDALRKIEETRTRDAPLHDVASILKEDAVLAGRGLSELGKHGLSNLREHDVLRCGRRDTLRPSSRLVWHGALYCSAQTSNVT